MVPRKNHVAVLVGKYMLVHGGRDDTDVTLNDFNYLNFESLKWHSVNVEDGVAPYLSHHTAISVFDFQTKVVDLFNITPKKEAAKNKVRIYLKPRK